MERAIDRLESAIMDCIDAKVDLALTRSLPFSEQAPYEEQALQANRDLGEAIAGFAEAIRNERAGTPETESAQLSPSTRRSTGPR